MGMVSAEGERAPVWCTAVARAPWGLAGRPGRGEPTQCRPAWMQSSGMAPLWSVAC